jgi:hypothetical protein
MELNPLPGTTAVPDPFNFYFDEYGNGSYQTTNNQGNPIPPSGSASGGVSNGIAGVPNGYLTYVLPNTVNAGSVYVLSSSTGSYLGNGIYGVTASQLQSALTAQTLVEGLAFFTSGTSSYLQFYANPPPASPAATGFPAGFVPSSGNYLAVVESSGSFSYNPGPLEGGYVNEYFGMTQVPEPSRAVAICGLFGVGLVAIAFRRLSKARRSVPAG